MNNQHRRKRSLSLDSSNSEPEPATSKSGRSDLPPLLTTYSCTLPPTCSTSKPVLFDTVSALEAHHASHHAFICVQDDCQKIFPDERFLNLHLAECHDPLVEVRKERGEKTFLCFETTCKKRFSTPRARRLHLVDAHQYPKEFYFSLPAKGLNDLYKKYGEAVSLTRPEWKARQDQSKMALDSSPPSSEPAQSPTPQAAVVEDKIGEKKDDASVDDLASRFEASRMLVPNQIRFGKKGSKK